MTGLALTRVAIAELQPGDEARPTRTAQPYTVARVGSQHGSWAVLGADGTTRRYPATARVWRTDQCAGQTALDWQEPARA